MSKQNIDNDQEYKYGFTTDIENIKAPKGLSEKTIRFIFVIVIFPGILQHGICCLY